MFCTDYKLQFPVRVETPDPSFARALQQAIGGVEGEIRVAMQYMFQAWRMRGPSAGLAPRDSVGSFGADRPRPNIGVEVNLPSA